MRSPTFNWQGRTISLLTWTTAMECWSWSLPAGKAYACPMENRIPGSICNSCYAQQGRYNFRTTFKAQVARFEYLNHDPDRCLSDIRSFIADHRLPFFRVHDSGDFHSVDMIDRWGRLCASLPDTRFWFPTRAWTFPAWVPHLAVLNRLPNVSVRPSAQFFGDEPPVVPGLSDGTVSMRSSLPGIEDCPKTIHGGSCMSNRCRTCWDKDTYINYRPHGHRITETERAVRLTIGATS